MRFLSLLAILTILGVSGCKPAGGTGGNAGTNQTAAKKTYSRDELRALVMGKTLDEVIALLGKPTSTSEDSDGMMIFYKEIAIDPGTGKAGSAYMHTKNAVVARVNF